MQNKAETGWEICIIAFANSAFPVPLPLPTPHLKAFSWFEHKERIPCEPTGYSRVMGKGLEQKSMIEFPHKDVSLF